MVRSGVREILLAQAEPLDELFPGACPQNRSCATGPQELGEGGQQMCQEDEQVLQGRIG